MLQVTQAHLDLMAEDMRLRFDEELARHVSHQFPVLADMAGEPRTLEFASAARLRAEAAGLRLRGSVRLYVDLCLMCGLNVSHDYQYGCIGAGMAVPLWTEERRVERIAARARRYHAACVGDGAMIVARVIAQALAMDASVQGSMTAGKASAALAWIWPEKAAFLTRPAFHDSVADGWGTGPLQPAARWRRAWLTMVFGSRPAANPLLRELGGSTDTQTRFLRTLLARLERWQSMPDSGR